MHFSPSLYGPHLQPASQCTETNRSKHNTTIKETCKEKITGEKPINLLPDEKKEKKSEEF